MLDVVMFPVDTGEQMNGKVVPENVMGESDTEKSIALVVSSVTLTLNHPIRRLVIPTNVRPQQQQPKRQHLLKQPHQLLLLQAS